MIRLRLNKLMSRSSTLALAAFAGVLGSGGAVGTAQADITVTGPGAKPHVHNTTNQDFVLIEDGASLGIDPNPGGTTSFLNDPGIVIAGTGTADVGVTILDSTLQGTFSNKGTIFGDNGGVYIGESVTGTGSNLLSGFINSGLISSDSSDGVDIESSNLSGGFTNSGRILGGTGLSTGAGLEIENFEASSRTFSGGLTNSGTISGETGIYFGGKTGALIFQGGIHNSGSINGDDGEAIFVSSLVDFNGGIHNSSTGDIISDSDDGIEIRSATFEGGITNAGTIAGVATGVVIDGAAINIASSVDTFDGGIVNSGLISATATAATTVAAGAHGILVQANTFNDGILNTGTIEAEDTAVYVTTNTTEFNGGISNDGRIISDSSDGIRVESAEFNGGITNSGRIDSLYDGIEIDQIDEFNGDINNSGTINSVTDTGIKIDAADFNGAVVNSGTIESLEEGISIGENDGTIVTVFHGNGTTGVTNSGLIRSLTNTAIDIEAETFEGGVTNSGTIEADNDGIEIGDGDGESFTGGLTNSGTVLAGLGVSGKGIDINLDDFQGGITTTGLVDAENTGIEVDAVTFAGGISNDGTIEASEGVNVEVSTTFEGGIVNSGFIDATSGSGITVTGFNTFDGGVTNSGTILTVGDSSESAIGINIVGTNFNGGFLNSGLINSTAGAGFGDTGVLIDVTNFDGGFVNTGTILAEPRLILGPPAVGPARAAVVILANDFEGGVSNDGLIDSVVDLGVYIDVNAFHDGIQNSGTINSTDTGIGVIAQSFDGGFFNSGLIESTQGTGVRVQVSGDFSGGVTNNGTINASDDAIHMDVATTFSGGITNLGKLDAGDDGIRTEGSSFLGGIDNRSSGLILAGETGIQTTNTTFGGGITNAGSIISTQEGIDVSVTGFSGGLLNSGRISADDGDGVQISASTFTGGVSNSGLIESNTGTGIEVDINTSFGTGVVNSGTILAGTDGVNLDGATYNGGFRNTGTIQGGESGVQISASTFNDGFTNTGTIDGGNGNSEFGVLINGTNFAGGLTNSGLIAASGHGLEVDVTNWTGNLQNSGRIASNSYTALSVFATAFDGNIINTSTGVINSGTYTGVHIEVDDLQGGVTNAGTIDVADRGLYLDNTAVRDNIVNSGTIKSGGSTALYLSSTDVGGYVSNSGLIQAGDGSDAIYLDGSEITGGIFNSGTIIAGLDADALDASSTSGPITLTQTAGIIDGHIDLGNGYDDILNLNGGSLEGDIDGDLSDDTFNVGAGSAAEQGTEGVDLVEAGTFAYLSGEISDIRELNINSGTAVMGAFDVRDNGAGVTTGGEGIDEINVNNGGTLHLDDDTQLDANNDYNQASGGTVQFLLSRDLSDVPYAGQITADTANIDGTLLGSIDLEAFALGAGTTNFFTYEDVIDGNTLNGTFDNVGVLDGLIFFDLEEYYDGDDNVDLVLERLSFAEVLAAASQSSNQQAVGGVLEEIYNNGGFSGAFAAVFADLLGSSSYEEALAIYDQVLGAEHAQAALGAMNAMGQFQGFLGERMDVLHNGMGSAQWAMFGQPGTQVAMAETVLADASPSPAVGGSLVTTRNGNTISMFGGVHGNWTSVEGDTNGPGFDQDTFGISGGADYAFSSESIVGLGGSYQTSELEFESTNSGDVDTFAVGLFGTFGLGGGYLDANGNVAFHDLNTTRSTPGADAHGEYSATSWSLSGEVGTVIPVGRAYVSPMLSLTYVNLSVDSFTETDSAFALDVQGSDTDSFATVLGARAGDYFKVGKATVNLQGNLGWRHEFGDDKASFTGAFLEDPSLLFNVDSSNIASDSATFGVGSTVSISSRLEVYVNYDGVWNAEADSHNASLGVRANW